MLNEYLQKILNGSSNIKYFNNIKVFISIGILIIMGIIVFVIYPSMQQIYLISNSIFITKNELSSKKVNNYSLKDIIQTYRDYEPKINTLNDVVRVQDRELEFITSLESIAEKYNLDQKINMEPSEQYEDTKFNIMPLQLSITGTYLNNLKYLQDLENLPVFINIKNINLSYKGQAISRNIEYLNMSENGEIITPVQNITMDITAETYWQ